MAKFRLAQAVFILPLALLPCSCQRQQKWDLVSVKGTVTQAGRPLPGVKVVFWTDIQAGGQGPATSAFTDANGHYELRTQAGEQGATAGPYRVCIVGPPRSKQAFDRFSGVNGKIEPSASVNDRAASTAPSVLVPPEFNSFEKTPLRAEVKAGGGRVFDFDVPEASSLRPSRKAP